MSRMIDDEETLKDNGLIEIDGCNVAEERKFLIHTDKYSIGEDGLIKGEIPFTDICYNLALQLQWAKAELEMSKHYAELLKANRCHHTVLGECSADHHNNCVGKKQCILDLEQIINNLQAENEKLKKHLEQWQKFLSKGFCDCEANESLREENKKLKEEIKDLNFYINEYKIVWEVNKLNKYKQTLNKIKKLCESQIYSDVLTKNVIELIKEAENE